MAFVRLWIALLTTLRQPFQSLVTACAVLIAPKAALQISRWFWRSVTIRCYSLPGSQEVFPPQCQPFQFSPEIRPAFPFAAWVSTVDRTHRQCLRSGLLQRFESSLVANRAGFARMRSTVSALAAGQAPCRSDLVTGRCVCKTSGPGVG